MLKNPFSLKARRSPWNSLLVWLSWKRDEGAWSSVGPLSLLPVESWVVPHSWPGRATTECKHLLGATAQGPWVQWTSCSQVLTLAGTQAVYMGLLQDGFWAQQQLHPSVSSVGTTARISTKEWCFKLTPGMASMGSCLSRILQGKLVFRHGLPRSWEFKCVVKPNANYDECCLCSW